MIVYKSEREFVESCTTLEARIAAIDAIIESLLLSAASSTANEGISEYWLNDGQTQIKTVYRSGMMIQNAVTAWQRMRNYYANSKAGRVSRFMDAKNFPGGTC